MTTVNLNAAYFPAVEFVSALATVGILLYRRPAGRSTATSRSACSSASSPRSTASSTRSASSRRSTRPTSRAWRRSTRSSSCSTSEPDLVDAPDAIDLPRAARRDPLRRRLLRATATATERRRSSRSTTCRLTIPPGQTVALVGATGAGKSTFAKLVARFYDPTDGPRARRRPRPARRCEPRRCARRWGSCRRRRFLFSGTVARQHRLRPPGRDGRGRSRPPRARSARGTSSAALPDGLDTEVGERGVQLSAGQRQLVAFARALDRRPADPRPRRGDLERRPAHRGPHRGTACAACSPGARRSSIAHRLSTIRQAGRIVVLDHGRIVEQGTHDELIAAGGRVRARSTATGPSRPRPERRPRRATRSGRGASPRPPRRRGRRRRASRRAS